MMKLSVLNTHLQSFISGRRCELLFQVSGVNHNAGSVCILCEQNVCAGEHLLASAQNPVPKPRCSGWIKNKTIICILAESKTQRFWLGFFRGLLVGWLRAFWQFYVCLLGAFLGVFGFNSRERALVGMYLIFFC